MKNRAFTALLCPHCGSHFSPAALPAPSISCAAGHSFDMAKQGYVNLLTGSGTKFIPDTAAMVTARDAFLEAGHYQPLATALTAQIQHLLASAVGEDTALVVDAGTGTGWYLQQILAASPTPVAAVGLDISKFALRRAARRNPQAINVVWDLWQPLPLQDATADVVLVVFAPRNAAEFARVLKPSGTLLVVTPLPTHLADIAQDAGMLRIQDGKEESLNASLAEHFVLAGATELEIPLELSPADVEHVALMGPAGHHWNGQDTADRLVPWPVLTRATAAFRISVFRPLASG